MGRHSPNSAERGFFAAILEEGPLTKRAVDLDPATADILGVQSVSPSTLKNLESKATVAPTASPLVHPSEDSEPDAAQELADAGHGVEIGSANNIDTEPAPDANTPVEPALPSRLTHGKLLTDKRAHPLQIYDILCMRYQADWAEWEPETLWWALRRDFGPVGEIARNKIMALRLAVLTDVPWLDWDTFENSALAWNDTIPFFGAFQPISPMQAAFAIQVLRVLRTGEEFSWEVKAYVAAILEDNGFVYAPEEWFDGAQGVIDRKVWLLGFKTEVAEAWEKIKNIDQSQIEWDETNPLHVHLIKLAAVNGYLLERASFREKVPGGGASAAAVSPPVPA